MRLLILSVVMGLTVAACASSGPKRGDTSTAADADKVLLDRGNEGLKDKKWAQARTYFTKLLDSYPQSAYRADAKLGLGDTYVGEGTTASYVYALNEFREFLSFYPTSSRADYAQLQIGKIHYNQMAKPGRDQTETREAVRELQIFVTRYPNSSLLPEAQKLLREARDRIDDSELQVAQFYLHIRVYRSAVPRLKGLLQDDPEYTHKDAVYFYLAECLEKSDNQSTDNKQGRTEALPYYQRLVDEFQSSEYLEEAKRRIERLKTELGQ